MLKIIAKNIIISTIVSSILALIWIFVFKDRSYFEYFSNGIIPVLLGCFIVDVYNLYKKNKKLSGELEDTDMERRDTLCFYGNAVDELEKYYDDLNILKELYIELYEATSHTKLTNIDVDECIEDRKQKTEELENEN